MRAWSCGAALVIVACAALGACGGDGRPAKGATGNGSDGADGAGAGAGASDDGFSRPGSSEPAAGGGAGAGAGVGAGAGAANAPTPAVSSGAMPPPTPRKPGCLDSTRGARHTFVGKLEKHPDGSGAVRVKLPKKVCVSGGRFSAGDTDEVILDIDDARARPLLTKKVKVSGTSQDFAPLTPHAYVMRLEVTSLAVTK